MKLKTKVNITDTESTGKHTEKESIENTVNIDINHMRERTTGILTQNRSQIVGITAVNTDIQIRVKSNNPQRILICHSRNKNVITGKSILFAMFCYDDSLIC